jgi:hypothetical protein
VPASKDPSITEHKQAHYTYAHYYYCYYHLISRFGFNIAINFSFIYHNTSKEKHDRPESYAATVQSIKSRISKVIEFMNGRQYL